MNGRMARALRKEARKHTRYNHAEPKVRRNRGGWAQMAWAPGSYRQTYQALKKIFYRSRRGW